MFYIPKIKRYREVRSFFHSFLSGKQIGNTVLFFGCRKKSEDYIYEDELTSYEGNGTLTDLHVAFSRDQV